MKKAIAKLPANEFSAIRNINDIPLVYHDKVNKKVLNAFAGAK